MGWGSILGTGAGIALGGALGGPAGASLGAGLGGALGGQLAGGDGMDRQAKAEKLYGGVDRQNYYVPRGDEMYRQYSNFINQQQGPGVGQRLLQQEAMGKGIGQQLVRQQAQAQSDSILRQQLAQAAAARPGMGAMAARNAAFNAGNAQSVVGGQAAMAGGQMALNAQNQLTDAELRLRGLNDQRQLEMLRQRLALQQAQQQGGMGYESQRGQRYGALIGANAPTQTERTMGGIQGALGSYMQYQTATGGSAPQQPYYGGVGSYGYGGNRIG